MSKAIAGIILAAGKGTRMKSDLPKCAFDVCGVPMAGLVGRSMKAVGVARPIVVVGHQGQSIIDRLGESFTYVWQNEQLGTGHAALMAQPALTEFDGIVLVAPGDVPLITAEELQGLIDVMEAKDALCAIGVCNVRPARGYGRIVRDEAFRAMSIVEEKDATREQLDIEEINTGVFAFDAKTLFRILPTLGRDNAQGEYYLTDVVKAIYDESRKVETSDFGDEAVARGVNDRWQLAEANATLRSRIARAHCLAGVTIIDPSTTTIDVDVSIGADTVIHPFTVLRSGTAIGARCEIGPNSLIEKSTVGDDASINMSRVNESQIGSRVKIGPFAHVRPGSTIGDNVKVGNFVELKKSELGAGSAVSHLSYIGDATVGDAVNIGAGTITCNYDGYHKHRTTIGSRSFIGSNSTLIAPVDIGENAFVAAGSVITKDVPNDALGVARERQEIREAWVPSWRKRMESQ